MAALDQANTTNVVCKATTTKKRKKERKKEDYAEQLFEEIEYQTKIDSHLLKSTKKQNKYHAIFVKHFRFTNRLMKSSLNNCDIATLGTTRTIEMPRYNNLKVILDRKSVV